ncbi:MAG: PEP-CTERM sorting domain-containing protein [Chromatiaceae bacterium]|nr:PEP-CTERM sorting domain-containing protein [Chromatiaceae bacterium]
MRNIYKALLAGIALSCSAAPAIAGNVSVGGVTWDPDFSQAFPPLDDFTAQTKFLQWYVDSTSDTAGLGVGDIGVVPNPADAIAVGAAGVGDVLVGYGFIDVINGSNDVDFCTNYPCRLTYTFGGFAITGLSVTSDPLAPQPRPLFAGGWVNFYLDNTAPFVGDPNLTNPDEAATGNLWLSATAESFLNNAGEATTVNFLDGGILSGSVEVFLSVIGGAAFGNFDTDTITEHGGVPADFLYTGNSSFSSGPTALYSSNSNGQLEGNSIPEPGILFLFGAGLIGLGVMRKKAA